MKNIEKYYDVINERLNGDRPACIIYGLMNGNINYRDCGELDCNECNKMAFRWLNEEFKEPIKLTQFEYDLISIYKATENKFIGFRVLCELKEKGYYKNVDVGMRICEILNNCEVVENVD